MKLQQSLCHWLTLAQRRILFQRFLTAVHFNLTIKSIKYFYKVLLTSADVTKCCTETQPKTPNSKQWRCRSTVARKNSLERPKPRKKPREEPGCEGWLVIVWLFRVAIITKHGQDVQMFMDDQQGQLNVLPSRSWLLEVLVHLR